MSVLPHNKHAHSYTLAGRPDARGRREPNLHEETHQNLHEETHQNLHEETHQNLHEETHQNLHEETHQNLHEETHQNLHEETHQNLHKETHQNLHEETHQNLPEETHQNLHEETNQNLHEETHQNLHEETHQNLHEETHQNLHEETHQNLHEETHQNVSVCSGRPSSSLSCCPLAMRRCGGAALSGTFRLLAATPRTHSPTYPLPAATSGLSTALRARVSEPQRRVFFSEEPANRNRNRNMNSALSKLQVSLLRRSCVLSLPLPSCRATISPQLPVWGRITLVNDRQYKSMPTHGIGRWRHLLPKEASKKKKDKQQKRQILAATSSAYGTLNVQVWGYDMTLVEHFSQYIHNFCNRLGVNVAESYALPTKTTEVMLTQETGTKMYVDAVLKTHQRVIQLSSLDAVLVPVFLDVLLKNQPEGVQLSVREHTAADFQSRFKVRPELEELIAQVNA